MVYARIKVYPYGQERTIEFETHKALEKGIRSWVDMHSPGTSVDIDVSIVTPHKRHSDGSSTCGKCDICTEGTNENV